jgi:hypothetical protein
MAASHQRRVNARLRLKALAALFIVVFMRRLCASALRLCLTKRQQPRTRRCSCRNRYASTRRFLLRVIS